MRHNYPLISCLIFFAAHFSAPALAAESPEMVAVEPQSLKFEPAPGLPACAKAAPVRGDPAKGAAVLMIKFDKGCRVPWHWHSATEQVMIVSGSGTLEMKGGKKLSFRPGAYASLPAKHVHSAACSNACTVFVTTDAAFDIHYVDDAGKEIPAEEALKKPAASKASKK